MNGESPKERALRYIRDRYVVPAYIGVTVIDPDGKTGEIVGGDGGYVMVLLPGQKRAKRYHPTWEMTYLASSGTVSFKTEERIRENAKRYAEERVAANGG